ncbi:hypothetical protein DITRI_Ditri18aG0113000 [Diplodiscus trichospermus]
MGLKSRPQAFLEDFCVVNGQNGVSCDDFSVDDLFDFTNEDGFLEQQCEDEDELEEVPVSSSSPSPKRQKLSHEDHFCNGDTNFDYSSLSMNELVVPQADDVADLEWLSYFVEDSFSEHSSAYPTGTLIEKPKLPENNKLPQPEKPVTTTATCFKTPIPSKVRSKRTRTSSRVWSPVASPSLTESSSSSTSSSSSSNPSNPWLLTSNSVSVSTSELSEPVSLQKHKKRPATDTAGGNGTQPTRRCSHCGVTKTPQWRAGPVGAKILCNACGVRFKSGRLLPEFRPVCSPTFSSELHSNHHRKVLEMRCKKEILNQAEPGLTLPVDLSFG